MSDQIGAIDVDAVLGFTDAAPVNRQLYENGNQAGGAVEARVRDSSHGYKTPNLNIQTEKPEHRIAIYLKAQGKSNREIAKLIGYSEPWVSQLLRQPWARQRVFDIIKETGGDEVSRLLASTTVDSVYTLIELRDSEKAPPAVRASAATQLLDRVLGKPVQHVETTNTNINVPAEVALLEQQLKGVDEELKRFGQN